MAEHKLSFIIDAQNKAKAAIDQAKNQIGGLESKIKNMQPTFQKMALVGTASFTAISAGIYKSVQAYQASERATTRLTHLLKQTSNATDEQVESLIRQASALQAVGVVEDDTIKFGQSQLATFALQADTIEMLTPSLLDLVVANKGVNATQEDMINIGNLVGKVMTGQVSALSRYGVTLNDVQKEQLESGNEMERAAVLVEVLQQNFGGLNEATRKTSEGGMQALKNSFGDLIEIIGETFIPILTSIVEKVTPVIEKISTWIEANPELARNIGIAALAISGLVAVVGLLGMALPAIIAGFTLLFSPIALVVGIVAALITIGILFYKRWDEIMKQLTAIWDLFVFKIEQSKNTIKEILYQIEKAFSNAYDWIKEKFVDPIKNAFDSLIGSLTRVWDTVRSIGGTVGGAVGRLMGGGQFGIETVPRTGTYLLHRGETVNAKGSGGSIIVNINGGYYLSETVAEEIGDTIIDKLKRTMKL